MPAIDAIDIGSNCPERHLDSIIGRAAPGSLLAVDFQLERFWLRDGSAAALTAIYQIPATAEERIRFTVVERAPAVRRSLQQGADTIEAVAERLGTGWFDSTGPIPLQPVAIPKPWGEEIWYTGMERRGVAAAGPEGRQQPLPWVLAALPGRLCRHLQQRLILLKILAPLPTPVYGDLYFELHREKREVYVVTHVDRQAWPDGVGAIRFGFRSERRAEFGSDEAFRQAFVAAVGEYEQVRRTIDQRLDERRRERGIALDAPLSPALMAEWIAELPTELVQQERQRRRHMESFTELLPLRVGDVVKVPTLTPHALQHGVRTVEFQTPVYERLILSFAQKVLTQAHWDTGEAAAEMFIDTPPQEESITIRKVDDYVEERIVSFDDFEVRRHILDGGGRVSLPAGDSYRLCMAVQGELALGQAQLEPEQAALLPPGWAGAEIVNEADHPLIFLTASPRSAGSASA